MGEGKTKKKRKRREERIAKREKWGKLIFCIIQSSSFSYFFSIRSLGLTFLVHTLFFRFNLDFYDHFYIYFIHFNPLSWIYSILAIFTHFEKLSCIILFYKSKSVSILFNNEVYFTFSIWFWPVDDAHLLVILHLSNG